MQHTDPYPPVSFLYRVVNMCIFFIKTLYILLINLVYATSVFNKLTYLLTFLQFSQHNG